MLIENGLGNVVVIRIGILYEMGIEVIKGNWLGILKVGMKNIIIIGKNKDGKLVMMGNLICVDLNEFVVFLY